MQPKPVLLVIAVGILVAVVAAAAFTAGLYLGQRGYVADLQYEPQQTGPGQQQPAGGIPPAGTPPPGPAAGQPNPNGFAPGGGPPGAPYWPADFMGRLVSLTAESVTLDTPQGPVTISLAPQAQVTDNRGNAISASDLKPGDVLAVFGRDLAAQLMRLSPRPNP